MSEQKSDPTVLCPRCEVERYTPYGADYHPGMPFPPALSRVADIYICSPCGQNEALMDFAAMPPVPPDEWPIKEEA